MSKFSDIFKQLSIKEETEASTSSEEMIDQNTTTLNSMSYTHVEPGQFGSEERTDLDNVDANRAEQPDENGNYPSKDCQDGDKCDLAQHPADCTCPECLNSVDDEETVLAKEILGVDAVVFPESSFRKAFNKVMLESDVEGIKKYNYDARVTANMVKRALDAQLPELSGQGLQVEQRTTGNRNEEEYFVVLYSGDAKLPKELKAEVDKSNFVKMTLDKDEDGKPAYFYAED